MDTTRQSTFHLSFMDTLGSSNALTVPIPCESGQTSSLPPQSSTTFLPKLGFTFKTKATETTYFRWWGVAAATEKKVEGPGEGTSACLISKGPYKGSHRLLLT